MTASDTIVAPATPNGTSALAIVRVSGPGARELADAALGHPPLEPRAATHRSYHDRHGQLVDDVVATFYQGPQSYTGEDLLEVSSHEIRRASCRECVNGCVGGWDCAK